MEGKMYRRSTSTVAVMFMTVAALASLAAAASAHPAYIDDRRPGDDPRSILWDGKQAAFERMMAAEALPPTAARASQDDYDVTFYDIDIAIDDGPETVSGSVTMRGKSLIDDLTTVILDLYDNMTVDSVAHDGSPASYAHNNDHLTVNLNTALQTGDDFEVKVVYHGAPVDDALNFSTHGGGNPIISSLSEPIGARQWWPCKDTPADKSDSARIAVTVDASLVAVSNGMLVDVAVNGTTKTYTWFESYPITTYLISVAVSNYSEFVDTYIYDSGTMPIEHYVYPEDYADALVDLSITPEAIAAMADIYGPYPFLEERYGHAEFPWGGAMEHETCTSYGAVLIRGDHFYDWVLVHELSHQWWGDKTTCATWDDVWLNEGFASYSEALWFEALDGESGYDDYIESFDTYGYFNGPIYHPDETFNRTVYDKGALVLHMLRRVLALQDGAVDHYPMDRLQAVLAEYGSTYAYDSATTEEFQSIAESHYGGSLDWFFQPWVYGENRPDYRWSWTASTHGPPYQVMVHVDQVQTNAGLFTMPIDIRIHTTGGDVIDVAWNDALSQDFFFEVNSPVTDVEFDPDNWILKYVTETTTDVPADGLPAAVALTVPTGAAGSSARLSYSLPADGHVELAVYDVAGRKVNTLVDRFVPAGTYEVSWDGPPASGVYFARLVAEAGTAVTKLVIVR
jgi:aminopeptidase N